MADAGPDGDRRERNGAGDKLGVEGGEVALGTAPPDDDDEIGTEAAEPGEGGGDLGGRVGPCTLDGSKRTSKR